MPIFIQCKQHAAVLPLSTVFMVINGQLKTLPVAAGYMLELLPRPGQGQGHQIRIKQEALIKVGNYFHNLFYGHQMSEIGIVHPAKYIAVVIRCLRLELNTQQSILLW